jgi:molecular chaperone GrpE
MNNENNQPQNEQQDQLAEELKMQSEAEASEQTPIEEMNELDSLKISLQESNEKYIRLYADFENYKRKMHQILDQRPPQRQGLYSQISKTRNKFPKRKILSIFLNWQV